MRINSEARAPHKYFGYADGVSGTAIKRAAIELIEKLPQDNSFVPVRALGELLCVLV